jgi:hypothetical protein
VIDVDEEEEEWLPAQDFYLDHADDPHVRPSRPFCQGDVLTAVPVSLYRKYPPKRAGDYSTAAKERTVMLYNHPCSIYDGPNLARVQTVVVASPAASALGGGWAHPWPGYLRFFPLPGLFDAEDWVADLSQIAVTRVEYLENRRIACLNLQQMAAFQGRCARLVSRMDPLLTEHVRRVEPQWHEFRFWERWHETRGTFDGFQDWLDQPSSTRPGASRRQMLGGAPDEVEMELNGELGLAASE